MGLVSDTVSVYFYFFSTVAQVFAAILGVLGMFAVFRLEQIRSKLETDIQSTGFLIAQFMGIPEEVNPMISSTERQAVLANFSFDYAWVINHEIKAIDRLNHYAALERERSLNGDESRGKKKHESVVGRIEILKSLKEEEQNILNGLKSPMIRLGMTIALSIASILSSYVFHRSLWVMSLLVGIVLLLSLWNLKDTIGLVLRWMPNSPRKNVR